MHFYGGNEDRVHGSVSCIFETVSEGFQCGNWGVTDGCRADSAQAILRKLQHLIALANQPYIRVI